MAVVRTCRPESFKSSMRYECLHSSREVCISNSAAYCAVVGLRRARKFLNTRFSNIAPVVDNHLQVMPYSARCALPHRLSSRLPVLRIDRIQKGL